MFKEIESISYMIPIRTVEQILGSYMKDFLSLLRCRFIVLLKFIWIDAFGICVMDHH